MHTLIAVDALKPKDATKVIDGLMKTLVKKSKVQMNAPKRGGKRGESEPEYFTTDDRLRKYAEVVNSVRPLWVFITDYFKLKGHSLEIKEEMREEARFKNLTTFCSEVPDRLLENARQRRYKLDSRKKKEYSPLGLALRHASIELNVPPYEYETLKKRYYQGRTLLNMVKAHQRSQYQSTTSR